MALSDLIDERLVQVTAPVPSSRSATARYGTVLYAGPVAGTSGEWLGVEWDDEEKGRHDGEHKGRRYFKTSQPGAGNFLRAKGQFIVWCEGLIGVDGRKARARRTAS